VERAESRRVTSTKVDWEFIGADCPSREPLGFESGGLASVRVLRSYVTVNVICRSAALLHLGTRRSASVAREAVRTTTLVDAMVVRGYLVMHDRGMSPFSCALLLTRAVARVSELGRKALRDRSAKSTGLFRELFSYSQRRGYKREAIACLYRWTFPSGNHFNAAILSRAILLDTRYATSDETSPR